MVWVSADNGKSSEKHFLKIWIESVKIYLCIDDTDNLESPGSGVLADILAKKLQHLGLASQCSDITRHQLFVHKDIPYTSHNSSMCFSADIDDHTLADITQFAAHFLTTASAPGSDPGLCIAVNSAEREASDRQMLIDFGLKAKRYVLTKQEAYILAQKTGVHLSEHGGTGDGVVGALAALGLRLYGSDGRIRGWLNLGKAGQITTAKDLCTHPSVDDVVDDKGMVLPEDSPICLNEEKIKTVFLNHRRVIPVVRKVTTTLEAWSTLTKAAVKCF